MRGQIGGSELVTVAAATVTPMPAGLVSMPTGLMVEVLDGELWYVLNGGTPVADESHRLSAGDILEVAQPHRLRVLSPAGATLYVTRTDSTEETRVTRAPGEGGSGGGLTDDELRASPVEVTAAPVSYLHVDANTAGVAVKAGAGQLATVTINTVGATGNTLTLYDDTAANPGSEIAIIDTTMAMGTLVYDAAFATGLYLVLEDGTPADLTVGYV